MATTKLADYKIVSDDYEILKLQEKVSYSFSLPVATDTKDKSILSFCLRTHQQMYPKNARLEVFINGKNILAEAPYYQVFHLDGKFMQTSVHEVIQGYTLVDGYSQKNNLEFILTGGEEGSKVLLSDVVLWYQHQAQY